MSESAIVKLQDRVMVLETLAAALMEQAYGTPTKEFDKMLLRAQERAVQVRKEVIDAHIEVFKTRRAAERNQQ